MFSEYSHLPLPSPTKYFLSKICPWFSFWFLPQIRHSNYCPPFLRYLSWTKGWPSCAIVLLFPSLTFCTKYFPSRNGNLKMSFNSSPSSHPASAAPLVAHLVRTGQASWRCSSWTPPSRTARTGPPPRPYPPSPSRVWLHQCPYIICCPKWNQ